MNFLENIGLGKNNWWRYLVFFAVLIVANVVGTIPYSILALKKAFNDPDFKLNELESDLSIGLDKNIELVLMLLPFIATFLAFVFLVKPLFNSNNSQIINGTNSIRWNRILNSFMIWFLLLGSVSLIDYFIFETNYRFYFDPLNFFILIIISLLLLPIQTTTEELFFRGSLSRGVAWITKNRLATIVIPGILFGLVHISNPEVEKFGTGLAMTQYITMGLFLGLITILDDGIELAIGMHAANNIFASIFITFEGSVLQTYALFRIDTLDPVKDVYALFIGLAVFLFLLHRKYKFDFSVLTRKLEFNTPQIPEQHQDQ